MAVAVAKLTPNADHVEGNRKIKIRTLVFSGNYATAGEALTAATLGLRKIDFVQFDGPAVSTDQATSILLTYDYANSKVLAYEGSADGTALGIKTNAEAYPTGCNCRVRVTGY